MKFPNVFNSKGISLLKYKDRNWEDKRKIKKNKQKRTEEERHLNKQEIKLGSRTAQYGMGLGLRKNK